MVWEDHIENVQWNLNSTHHAVMNLLLCDATFCLANSSVNE